MKQIEKKQILDLLGKPLEFLARLYDMFEDVSVFNEASNKIFTNHSEKEAFLRLTDNLHDNIVKMFQPHSDRNYGIPRACYEPSKHQIR